MEVYINEEQIIKEAQNRLQRYLPIEWEGNRYNAMDAWNILIASAAMGGSLASVCRECKDTPHNNTLRDQLTAQNWNDEQIEEGLNKLLAESSLQSSWPGSYQIAIDLHEEPFYGEIPQEDPEIIRRGEAKAGTTYFHVFATAYVIRSNRRWTLALARVRANESMLSVVDRMRERVENLGIKVSVYLLDRQFWCYELLEAWKEIPYIIPIRKTGKEGSGGGTRPLFEFKKSQFETYTMTSQTKQTMEIEVAVVVLPETAEQKQKRISKFEKAYQKAKEKEQEKAQLFNKNPTPATKRSLTCAKNALDKAREELNKERKSKLKTALCYAVNKVKQWSLKQIYQTYRRRFGIESSYRQSRQARMVTTSRKPWFRLLRFGIAMALRNLWIEVRWLLGEPKQGRSGRKIPKDLLPFPMFLRWIVSAFWKIAGFRTYLLPQSDLPEPLWKRPQEKREELTPALLHEGPSIQAIASNF